MVVNLRQSFPFRTLWQAALLVLDDVMDGSPLRRGRAAWHARPDVGIAAVNDGLFLENCVLLLLE